MQVLTKNRVFPLVKLSKDQVRILRAALNCVHVPIQYAGGIMYWHGGGWYEVSANRCELDWATDEQMIKALLRRIHEILFAGKEQIAVDYSKPNVGRRFIDAGLPIRVNSLPKPKVEAAVTMAAPTNRLEVLANRLNSKYHRA